MNEDEVIQKIREFDPTNLDIVSLIKQREFDQYKAEEYLDMFRSYQIAEDGRIPAELVHEMVYVPILAYWTRENLAEHDAEKLDHFIDGLFTIIIEQKLLAQ